MPDIILVAGPNGAGKSTFIERFLPSQLRACVNLNADEIEREVATTATHRGVRQFRAARIILGRIENAIGARSNLMLETTLASRNYAIKIPSRQACGYRVALNYPRLSSADRCMERVKKRVLAGGHNIPEDVVRRRFSRNLIYLDTLYKPLVNEWYVWDSIEGDFVPADACDMQ